MKIYRKNLIIHNLTELAIYPGIATVFVPILNFWRFKDLVNLLFTNIIKITINVD